MLRKRHSVLTSSIEWGLGNLGVECVGKLFISRTPHLISWIISLLNVTMGNVDEYRKVRYLFWAFPQQLHYDVHTSIPQQSKFVMASPCFFMYYMYLIKVWVVLYYLNFFLDSNEYNLQHFHLDFVISTTFRLFYQPFHN